MNRDIIKDVIADSFYRLLQKESFERISVTSICNTSKVSRSTFYRLFKDKYEVMEYFFHRDCEKLIEDNPSREYCRRYLLGYAELIKRHSQYFHTVLSLVGQNNFSSFLFDLGVNYYTMLIEKATSQKVSSELALKIRLFTAGTVYITRDWIQNGLQESPEKLSELVYESMPREMYDIINSTVEEDTVASPMI